MKLPADAERPSIDVGVAFKDLDRRHPAFYISLVILDVLEDRMALSLKDKETDRLAREVAALTGETLTDTIRIALSERLQRERLRRAQPIDLAARFRAIGEHCASLPDRDTRSPDDILGYDENGLWN